MASSVVQSAAQQLGTLLVEEAKSLYAVRDKIESLQRDLKWMECFLQDADYKAHQEKVVRQWVTDIREFTYEAEDIIMRYVYEVSHHRKSGIRNALKRICCLICDAWALHEVGSNIDNLRAKITQLTTNLQTYGIQTIRESESSTYSAMLREQRRTYPHIEEYVVGLEKDVENVVGLLVNKEYQVVGICGMGGLGKTTLAKKVYSSTPIKRHFNSCAWIYVSQKIERRRVFEEILKGVGGEDVRNKDLTDEQLPAKICQVLESKKCLVVLDDIWTINAWKLLEPAFTSIRSSQSKVLLTTRNQEILNPEDFHVSLSELQPLEEEEAWTLLKHKAFFRRQSEDAMVKPEMEALGREMLKHCRGLPLAIIALGGILATKKTIEEWKVVQQKITSYLTSDEGEGSRVLSVLEMSFYELPFYLKPCFLYLGHFPEDYKISAERLYRLWEAEGIISAAAYDEAQSQGMSRLEIAERYLNELVRRSMVQLEKCWPNGRIQSCRLHDVMRDVCLKKCKEVNFLSVVEHSDVDNPSSRIASSSIESKRTRRCAIHHWSAFFHHHRSNASCLRSLLVFVSTEYSVEDTDFSPLKNFSLLQVLDIEGNLRFSNLKGIEELIHLRYLRLAVEIKELPSSFCDLKYLETLVLETFGGSVTLPNKFWKMERLRHLYLPRSFEIKGSGQLTIGSSDHQLSQMETLKNFHPEKCKMEGLLKMTHLRILSFSNYYCFEANEVWKRLLQSPQMTSGQLMNCLKLQIDAAIINEDPTIFTSSKIQAHISKLEISGPINVKFHHDQVVFPHGLTKLELVGSSNMSEEGISELEKLPHLKELFLREKAIRGNRISISDGGFPQLVVLGLRMLWDLEEWEVGKGALPNLRTLFIYICSKWEEWQVGKGAMPNLCLLFIDGCPKLKMLPKDLPSSIEITCDRCVNGIEKYNRSPEYKDRKMQEAAASSSPSLVSESDV